MFEFEVCTFEILVCWTSYFVILDINIIVIPFSWVEITLKLFIYFKFMSE